MLREVAEKGSYWLRHKREESSWKAEGEGQWLGLSLLTHQLESVVSKRSKKVRNHLMTSPFRPRLHQLQMDVWKYCWCITNCINIVLFYLTSFLGCLFHNQPWRYHSLKMNLFLYEMFQLMLCRKSYNYFILQYVCSQYWPDTLKPKRSSYIELETITVIEK